MKTILLAGSLAIVLSCVFFPSLSFADSAIPTEHFFRLAPLDITGVNIQKFAIDVRSKQINSTTGGQPSKALPNAGAVSDLVALTQSGFFNESSVMQSGGISVAQISQLGLGGSILQKNSSIIEQNGDSHLATVVQKGFALSATVSQDGSNNTAMSSQFGSWGLVSITQTQDSNQVNVSQTNNGGALNSVVVAQAGSRNLADIVQNGGGFNAFVRQGGIGNVAIIRQHL